jgi:hypothetical protein
MDADLYDHLSTSITSKPPQLNQQEDHEDSTGKADVSEGQEVSEPESLVVRRQRTMSASLPEEIDQVVHAISSSQWAARLGSLMDSVKKQVLSYSLILCLLRSHGIRVGVSLKQRVTELPKSLKLCDQP